MLLTIDVGNTMTDFGLFKADQTPLFYRIRSRADLSAEEAIASFSVFLQSKAIAPSSFSGAILSSVVPALTELYLKVCRTLLGLEPKVVGPGLKTGLKIVTDNPKEVGADMIAAAIGAKVLYGAPCIVADFGTANKVFLLDPSGAFVGCTIGAGIGLQVNSLSQNAALLPEVSPSIPAKILGKNTVDCMNSALTYGNAFMIRSLVEGIEKEAGYPCKKVLTGGFAETVKDLLPEFTYEPHLVLQGLLDIYRRNAQ